MSGPRIPIEQFAKLLNSCLFLLLLGGLFLFVAYWNLGHVPDGLTLFNITMVVLVLVVAGAMLLKAEPAQSDQFYKFCSSGLFFITLGLVLLYVANRSIGHAHAGMTFVLVVLGVALLLYGTGTQGTADLKTDSNAAKYNVAIAGGAGVLAFCVAYGIIEFSPQMREAFQIERKFIRLQIQEVGREAIPLYASAFKIDGEEVPFSRRNGMIEILIPYLSSDLARLQTKPIKTDKSEQDLQNPAKDALSVCPRTY
jgi:hypothetical protein